MKLEKQMIQKNYIDKELQIVIQITSIEKSKLLKRKLSIYMLKYKKNKIWSKHI